MKKIVYVKFSRRVHYKLYYHSISVPIIIISFESAYLSEHGTKTELDIPLISHSFKQHGGKTSSNLRYSDFADEENATRKRFASLK